ncbi:hypothetical protein EYR41_006176 [Orbilia oligospora]|uniref:Uncharacterized protein n=1 Tax=Orbilia oligospora TaxID=2813651 RepID=A0A7C8P2Y9_ORBOL|nr:hypothetical protein TWF751_004060 [Orbilia oligospora]TGJ70198.1 hypothetical protein EYR41_006176 [Orbilia oligospora]
MVSKHSGQFWGMNISSFFFLSKYKNDYMKNVMYVPNCAYSIQVPGTTLRTPQKSFLNTGGEIPSQDSADLVQARIEKPVVFHAQACGAENLHLAGFSPPVPKTPEILIVTERPVKIYVIVCSSNENRDGECIGAFRRNRDFILHKKNEEEEKEAL